jgi:hypothetical protein
VFFDLKMRPQKKLYDRKFEKVLKIGEGAYGNVYKVSAKGIKKNKTTVSIAPFLILIFPYCFSFYFLSIFIKQFQMSKQEKKNFTL